MASTHARASGRARSRTRRVLGTVGAAAAMVAFSAIPASAGLQNIGHTDTCFGSTGWFITWHAWDGTNSNVSTPAGGSFSANYVPYGAGLQTWRSWGEVDRYWSSHGHTVYKDGFANGTQSGGQRVCW